MEGDISSSNVENVLFIAEILRFWAIFLDFLETGVVVLDNSIALVGVVTAQFWPGGDCSALLVTSGGTYFHSLGGEGWFLVSHFRSWCKWSSVLGGGGGSGG